MQSGFFFVVPDEHNEYPVSSEPQVFVSDQASELDKIRYLVPPQDLADLTKLDFEEFFVVALLRESQASSGYKVIIQRVTQRQNGSIAICAEFWSPNFSGSSEELTAAMTDYTHVVKVQRNAEIKGMATPTLQILEITPTPYP